MDTLDLAILREICRDKHFWWGGLDPRVSTEIIAHRLRVAGSTVRARVSQWERLGFLRGYDVIPNPALFGAHLAGGSLRVADPREKARVLDDLALVPGVKIAMEHVGAWIALILVAQDARDLQRTRSLVERLPGVAEVTPCNSYHGPAASIIPSPLDWRILAELRRTPRARVAEIAERARVSTRTVTRRYDALVRGDALMFWLLLDFTCYPGVIGRMIVEIAPDAKRADVARELRSRFPDAVELWPPHDAVRGYDAFDMFLHRNSVAAMEEAEHLVASVAGVGSVETLYPRQLRAYGDWVDARIASVLGAPR